MSERRCICCAGCHSRPCGDVRRGGWCMEKACSEEPPHQEFDPDAGKNADYYRAKVRALLADIKPYVDKASRLHGSTDWYAVETMALDEAAEALLKAMES